MNSVLHGWMKNAAANLEARCREGVQPSRTKFAFAPGAAIGGMPPGGGGMPPGMDPAMMGGMPPGMDPSMMGGMPPGGMPPMDPSMMGAPPPGGGGAPPMDPSMGGAPPPTDPAAAGGGGGDQMSMLMQKLDQLIAGGGAGGGGAKAPKVDPGTELAKLNKTVSALAKMTARLCGVAGIQFEATDILPDDIPDDQAAAGGGAPAGGASGGSSGGSKQAEAAEPTPMEKLAAIAVVLRRACETAA